MEDVHEVAVRIAQNTAPDEVDLAPSIVQAMLEGGDQLEDLKSRSRGPTLGGFTGGVEVAGDLFQILQCVASCAAILSSVFALKSHRLSIRVQSRTLYEHEQRADETKNSQTPPDTEQTVEAAISSLAHQLQSNGIASDRANEISRLTLAALLENPEASQTLLERFDKK